MKVYEYANCSTCKKALKFLEKNDISFTRVSITETPPTASELRKMLKAQGGNIRKLFNTSGLVYREMKLGDRLGEMSSEEAIRLLASNGKLIKRPFVLAGEQGLVGFNESEWKKILG